MDFLERASRFAFDPIHASSVARCRRILPRRCDGRAGGVDARDARKPCKQ